MGGTQRAARVASEGLLRAIAKGRFGRSSEFDASRFALELRAMAESFELEAEPIVPGEEPVVTVDAPGNDEGDCPQE